MDIVFDDDNARVLRSVHNELVSAVEDDVVAIAHIERHDRRTTIKSQGPSWENISILEHYVVGNSIEIMVTIDQASQTLLDDVEERVERSKGRVLRISHNFASASPIRPHHRRAFQCVAARGQSRFGPSYSNVWSAVRSSA